LSTSSKKYGAAALSLASGSYARSSAAGSNFSFGTSAFTVELFYFQGAPGSGSGGQTDQFPIFSASSGSSLTIGTQRLWGFPSTDSFYATTPVGTISAVTAVFGAWNHVALCRSGTSTRLFLNGTQVGSTQTDSTNYASTEFQLGGSNFNGLVDEVRITKGVARYTGNFTAPTAAFDAFYTPLVPAVPPNLNLPTVNTNMYRVWNLNAETLPGKPQTGQTIDGATGISLAQGDKKLIISDGATGWRTW
jgi:hypothetical protein